MTGPVSIILRTDGRRTGLLEQAVASVLDQSHAGIQLIVIEDGGHAVAGLVEAWGARRRAEVLYRSMPKGGRSRAGNLGLSLAGGHLIGFLDDDDLFLPNHVATLVAALEAAPHAGAAYGAAYEVPTRRLARGRLPLTEGRRRLRRPPPFSRARLWAANYLPIQSVMFRRTLYERHGGLDEELDYLEDWDLWLRYSHDEPFLAVPEVTSVYRLPMERAALSERAARHAVAHARVRAKHRGRTASFAFEEIEALSEHLRTEAEQRAGLRSAVRAVLRRLRLSKGPP